MEVVCLQAQRVTGLPASVHQIHLHLPTTTTLDLDLETAPRASASASREGIADFRNQVLLLHCHAIAAGPVDTSVLLTLVAISHDQQPSSYQPHQHLRVDLGRDQPRVLSFLLAGAAAGAVLTLALHHKLVPSPPATACLPLPACCRRQITNNNGQQQEEETATTNCCLPLPACCRPRINTNNNTRQQQRSHGSSSYDDGSSAGFIVIEKHCRRPPSDNFLLTSDDDQDSTMKLELDSSSMVEDEFLAMLEQLPETNTDLDLDRLIEDAEAELARTAHLLDAAAASM